MILGGKILSFPDFFGHAGLVIERPATALKDPHFILPAAIFLSLFLISALFGFLRWRKKKPVKSPENQEPILTLTDRHQPAPVQMPAQFDLPESFADNTALIADLNSGSVERRAKAARNLGERRAGEASGADSTSSRP